MVWSTRYKLFYDTLIKISIRPYPRLILIHYPETAPKPPAVGITVVGIGVGERIRRLIGIVVRVLIVGIREGKSGVVVVGIRMGIIYCGRVRGIKR